jgi:acetyl-CoA carboxylase biotin carboxyl carrier protein
MTVDEIRELINLAKETGVAVLEVQRGDNRMRVRLSMGNAQPLSQPVPAMSVPDAAPAAKAAAAAGAPVEAREEPRDKTADPALVYVKSPIVGTFYEAPSPGAPPFVRVGERIQPGKVLCIIESMKLMNEIEAEVAGVLDAKLVMNGQPVEYGESIFAVRPV